MPDLREILTAIEAISSALAGLTDTSLAGLTERLNANELLSAQYRVFTRELTAQTESTRLYTLYEADNPSSISPFLSSVEHNWTDLYYPASALCSALKAYVYGWAKAKADEIASLELASVTHLEAALALELPLMPLFAVAQAGVLIVLGRYATDSTHEQMMTALTDQDALDMIVLAMRDYMQARSINDMSSLGFALTEGSFSGNSLVVKQMIEPSLGVNYLPFLLIFGLSHNYLESNEVPVFDCPTAPPVAPEEDLACISQDRFSFGNILSTSINLLVVEAVLDGDTYKITWASAMEEPGGSCNVAIYNDLEGDLAIVARDEYGDVFEVVPYDAYDMSEFEITSTSPFEIEMEIYHAHWLDELWEASPDDHAVVGTFVTNNGHLMVMDAVLSPIIGYYVAQVLLKTHLCFTIETISTTEEDLFQPFYLDCAAAFIEGPALEDGDTAKAILYKHTDPFTLTVTLH